ncbi:hypothetical protein ACFSC6_00455 [Rufibacter sediminis]|uniref:Uncharacterized protein n=1 Tax=Rufibacter sediminis TaxID=2762756 RepID=A0ABR6VMN5_9BACT|nr:hypothetical protein [Rufibacter sediminis]MBC3538177.1 hypothetical protein [Rufibacter sediminis]
MLIHRLTLSDENLPNQRLFYTLATGFSPPICSDNAFTANTSTAGLTLNQHEAGENPAYHFAYTAPEKQLSGAETWSTNAADLQVKNRGYHPIIENRQMAGTGVKGLEPENGSQPSVQVASVQVPNQWPASLSRSSIAPKISLLRLEIGTYRCIGLIQENVEIRQ